MEINIAKQIIDQRVNKIMEENLDYFSGEDIEKRRSKTFLLLGVSAYLDMDISEALPYITDGGGDGGFDAAYIEEANDGQVNVILFQSKYTRNTEKNTNFPSNAIEKAVNTVKTVFDPYMDVQLNDESRRIVDEIRSLILDGYIPYVTFVMVNNGDTWDGMGQKYIDNAFSGNDQVVFTHYGYENILGYIKRKEPVNTEIKMAGMAIQENFNYKRVILGKVNVTEIVSLMERYGDRLLERNIRKYLGKNEINDNISATLRGEKRSNFFFYNNGITMICDQFKYNALQEKNWNVSIQDLQIINGGQTCRAIFQTVAENRDLDIKDVYVLVRLYEVSDDEDIINEITYATNHQNLVDLRDLKSNDNLQILLEESAKDLGYVYKRKRDSFSASGSIPSTVAAEAVLAIWRKAPHLARYKKNELFGAFYHQIFDGLNASQMIIAVLIFRSCDAARKRFSDDRELQAVRAYGNYFVSCLVGEKLCYDMQIKAERISHVNFLEVRDYFEKEKENLIKWAEEKLLSILRKYFDLETGMHIYDIDGRTLAAVFRRFDIVENYIKNGDLLA